MNKKPTKKMLLSTGNFDTYKQLFNSDPYLLSEHYVFFNEILTGLHRIIRNLSQKVNILFENMDRCVDSNHNKHFFSKNWDNYYFSTKSSKNEDHQGSVALNESIQKQRTV
jgi:hypothetical protein